MKEPRLDLPFIASTRVLMGAHIRLLRPHQWTKNLAVFPPLLFSFSLFEIELVVATILAFVAFSLASSSVYIINDIIDAERDRNHPIKSSRPIASGMVGNRSAMIFTAVTFVMGLGIAYSVSVWLVGAISAYWVINLVYSLGLKQVVILDVMSIASGFVLRVLGGTAAVSALPSDWLLTVTFFLALFIALGKRRKELFVAGPLAAESRPVLQAYDVNLLDQFIPVMAGLVIIAYTLFTISEYSTSQFGSSDLIYTVPFVVYGLFRYLLLIHRDSDAIDDPAILLLRDRPLQICITLWGLASVLIVYRDRIAAWVGA